MSRMTIEIEEDLRARIAAAADRASMTTQAFMLKAIERTVEQVEGEDGLHQLADARWAMLLTTGESVSWDEAKNYVAARVRGEEPAKPTACKPKGASRSVS